MKTHHLWSFLVLIFLCPPAMAQEAPLSSASQACLACHTGLHPGIVHGWEQSRHSRVTPQQGQQVDGLASRVSARDIPEDLASVAVGCAECHTARADAHADSFAHNGFQVHSLVSPDDCALCHSTERKEYRQNIMSQARGNLMNNPVYMDLAQQIHGQPRFADGKLDFTLAQRTTEEESCFFCHGSRVQVQGTETRSTDMGPMDFPVLTGWPNQGVGRQNPDNSLGSCTACHSRHTFSLAEARKPSACKECHVGPDVPAYKVYTTSKHGNIAAAQSQNWDFQALPWTVGQDFTAPTCAACHISLTVSPNGSLIAQRTHRMNDRLPWRIFGLIYAHPHPREADTSIIRNRDDMPLPTDFANNPAREYLISKKTQAKRQETMQGICSQCHAQSWTDGHFQRLENTIQTSNQAVHTATQIMQTIWDQDLAQGLGDGHSPFDEHIEKTWSRIWLINANKIRFTSAMAGGGDYGVFAQGRYELSNNLAHMQDWLNQQTKKTD